VVVEVVSECLNGIDGSVSILGSEMVLEEHKSDEASVPVLLDTTDTLKLKRSLLSRVGYTRSITHCLTSISEL